MSSLPVGEGELLTELHGAEAARDGLDALAIVPDARALEDRPAGMGVRVPVICAPAPPLS